LYFRTQHGRLPEPSEASSIEAIARALFLEEGVDASYFDNNSVEIPATWATFLPTNSVVGGILAQEIIKVMTKVGAPVKNFFVYSPSDFCGRSFFLEGDSSA
jgi:ubiquitin-like 1-activating enzyme E1 A